jgi:Leucine-rich repeat (LRR) protein
MVEAATGFMPERWQTFRENARRKIINYKKLCIMRNIKHVLYFLLAFTFMLTSCEKEDPSVDDNDNTETEEPIDKGEIITFDDTNLENVIRLKLNKDTGNIYTSELETITELDAGSQNIKSINGIEYCKNIQTLALHDNLIEDITPLDSLVNLTDLNLDWNTYISDISPLKSLTNLYTLGLSDISFLKTEQNFEAISSLTELRNIILSSCEALDDENSSSVSSLTNLHRLEVNFLSISDLSFVENLVNLKELYLVETQITDLSSIKVLNENGGLPSGSTLDIRATPQLDEEEETNKPIIEFLEQNGVKVMTGDSY